jgi:hypothetical protein
MWFYQTLRSGEIRLIDYYENRNVGLPHYVDDLQKRQQAVGYVYGQHWAPHDIQVRDFGTGKSRLSAAKQLGLTFQVCPDPSFADGINAVRLTLPKCYFDEQKCANGLESLRQPSAIQHASGRVHRRSGARYALTSGGCLPHAGGGAQAARRTETRRRRVLVSDAVRTGLAERVKSGG